MKSDYKGHLKFWVLVGMSIDRDLMKLKKRREFIENRKKAIEKTMKNHPEGITKDNLEQIKKELHREEKLKKEEKK